MEPAVHRRYQLTNVGSHIHFLCSWTGHGNVARSSLLQQEFCRLDARLGVKAGTHCSLEKSIVESGKCHPLVVRHVASDNRDRLAFGKSRPRVIQSLVKSELAGAPGSGKMY